MALNSREVPLVMEECALLTAAIPYALHLLGLPERFDPAESQIKIETFIKEYRDGKVTVALDENFAAFVGMFWALTIAVAYDWEWVAITYDGRRDLGVADRERRYIAVPITFFHRLIHHKDGDLLPGPALRFRAIGENRLMEADPGEFFPIAF